MLNGLKLRPANPKEHRLLTALTLRSKAHWGYCSDFMAACHTELTILEADIQNPHRHYVVAESAGKIVGFYTLEHPSNDEAEIGMLFVEPDYMRQGIGTQLVHHAIHQARRMALKSLVVHSDPHAVDFYRAMGGVEAGKAPSASIPGRYLPTFEISLDPPKPR